VKSSHELLSRAKSLNPQLAKTQTEGQKTGALKKKAIGGAVRDSLRAREQTKDVH